MEIQRAFCRARQNPLHVLRVGICAAASDPAGFVTWTKKGLDACRHRWEAETYRSALQLLVDGGAQPEGLSDGLRLVDAAMLQLP